MAPKRKLEPVQNEQEEGKKTILNNEEKDFPRGGGSILTPLEYRQTANEATRDALLDIENEQSEPKFKKLKKDKKDKKGLKDLTNIKNNLDLKKISPSILSYKQLTIGSLLLCQILDINSLEIILSLPYNLIGFVPVTNISSVLTEKLNAQFSFKNNKNINEHNENEEDDDDNEEDEEEEEEDDDDELKKNQENISNKKNHINLQKLFKKGQWLRAMVTSLGKNLDKKDKESKKHIQLSIHPQVINNTIDNQDLIKGLSIQASVKSIEEHGLILDLGKDSLKGFISKKELEKSPLSLDSINPGSVLLLNVLNKNKTGKIITLGYHNAFTKDQIVEYSSLTSYNSILPGSLAEFIVTNLTSTGLVGTLFGSIEATIDLFHVGSPSFDFINENFKPGNSLIGRLLYIIPNANYDNSNRIGFSILPHVKQLSQALTSTNQPLLDAFDIGYIFNNATVKIVNKSLGLFLDVNCGLLSYVHISKISDKRVDDLSSTSGPYKIGTTHNARIIGVSLVEGFYNLSMQKSILERKYLKISEIPITTPVRVQVLKFLPQGKILVSLDDGNFKGIVPENHISDIKLSNPERKFKIGSKVSARILYINHERNKIFLTLKKSIVNTQQDLITSYDEVKIGQKSVGTIISLQPRGAIVQFFNRITAFLPVAEISEAFIKNVKDHFRIGQSISVRVFDVDKNKHKILVTCRSSDSISQIQQDQLQTLVGGDIVKVKVLEKTGEDVVVEIEPSKLKGIINCGHLSDESYNSCRAIFKKLSPGTVFEKAVVLNKNTVKSIVTLSLKDSLIKASEKGELLTSFEQATIGSTYAGFVKNVTNFGVFIAFTSGVTGLAVRKNVLGNSQSNFEKSYPPYKSVIATAIGIDPSQHRLQLSLGSGDSNNSSKQKTKSSEISREVVNPVDSSLSSIDELVPGKITKACIKSIKDTQLNMQLADDLQGRIDMSMIFDDIKDIPNPEDVLDGFNKGTEMKVRVIGYHDARLHKYLPITHRQSNTKTIFELSAKPSVLDSVDYKKDLINPDNIDKDHKYLAFINNISHDGLWVTLSPSVHGRISLIEASDSAEDIKHFGKKFHIGKALFVTLLGHDKSNDSFNFSARESIIKSLDDVVTGSILPGKIIKTNDMGVSVRVSDTVVGTAFITDISDDYNLTGSSPAKLYSTDMIVATKVVEVDRSNKKLYLSLRPSDVGSFNVDSQKHSDKPKKIVDRNIVFTTEVKPNEVLRGVVKNVSDTGLFVSLGRHAVARVKISNLSDSFLSDWKKYFQVGQIVEGKVLSVDPETSRVEFTLKKSVVRSMSDVQGLGFKNFKSGQVVSGTVTKVADYGIFISIDGSDRVSGLCHKSEMADKADIDARKLFAKGDKVKAKILKIDPTAQRISFGLKASYFKNNHSENESDSETEQQQKIEDKDKDESDDNIDEDEEESEEEEEDDDDNGITEESGEDEVKEQTDKKKSSKTLLETSKEEDLSDTENSSEEDDKIQIDEDSSDEESEVENGLSAGTFDWSGNNLSKSLFKNTNEDDNESDSEDDSDNLIKKSKKNTEINEIVTDVTGDLSTRAPQSAQDFERLILGSPNSSVIWINYMAFLLQLSDLEKARNIGKRALDTISYREEDEKMNIWVALLNLENSFGNSETLEKVFKDACQYMDAEKVYERMARIYSDDDKLDEANKLYSVALKKFGQKSKIWIDYAKFLLVKKRSGDEARALLPRALQALPKREHTDVIKKFAQLEFQLGEPERGRTLFEGLISSYPRKIDIWNIFLDMEIKGGDKELIKRLFDRVKTIRLSSKQTKFFEKKYNDWVSQEKS